MSLFEVPHTPQSVAAFIAREHEFRFCAVAPLSLDRLPTGLSAVLCARNTDEAYRSRRCPPDEFQRRWAVHGVEQVWRDDVLPCRVYLRHCVLAASSFCPDAYESFMVRGWGFKERPEIDWDSTSRTYMLPNTASSCDRVV